MAWWSHDMETLSPFLTLLCRGINWWSMDSPHKWATLRSFEISSNELIMIWDAMAPMWRHCNQRDRKSNMTAHYCDVIMGRVRLKSPALHLFTQPFSRRRSKKTSKFRVTGLCVGNSPGTGEFPAQRASNAENVSIWWRHHENIIQLSMG